jgi:hypothetical protein
MVALREQLEASSFISLEQGENNRGKRGWILTLPDSLDKKIRSIIGLAPKPPKVKIVADGHDFIPSLSLVKMGIFMEYDFQVEKVESNNKSIYVSLTNSKDAECMIKRGVLQLRGKMFLVERP